MRTINVDIKPEPYQRSFFTQRERLSGMYSGRGVGKSWVMHTKSCIALASGENVLYLTPTNSLLRKQMMPRMLTMLRSWGLSATWNKSDETISVDGSTGILWGASYRNYDDVCRGADGVSTVCYDELAKADDLPLLFAAVAPTMRGARFEPQTIYATTPRKGSQCDRMVLNNELGRVVTGATIDDNTHVTEAERENMKRFLKGDLYRQAGHGRDYNVFYVIDDVHILEKVKIQKADSFEMNSIARGLIQKYNVRQVTVDGTGGYGQAIYDFLKLDPSLQVYFTNFGQAAEDHEHFANARAEMFFRLAEAMKLEFRLDDAETEEELRIISSDVNVSGKCILVSKDVIKKVLQRSPDSSDALALAYYNRKKMSTLDVAVNSMYKKMRMF